MSLRFSRFAAPAVMGFLFAACADKTVTNPSEKPVMETATVTEKPYKKPVRMHDRGKISSISLDQLFPLHQSDKVLIIDARPAIFFGFGHIPGAISIPAKNCDPVIASYEEQIKKAIADGKTVVTYCNGFLCPDAHTVASHISGFGYPASVFSGGWDSWKEADMPVE